MEVTGGVPPVINLTELAKREKEEFEKKVVDLIMELGAENILSCMQCGACASICPLASVGFEWYNRKLIKAILIGIKDELLDDPTPWACVACNRCVEICPRNVAPFEVMFAMRRLMVEEFAISTLAIEGLRSLYERGHAVYLAGAGKTRKKVGLPENPPSTIMYPEALEEVKTILKNSKLASLGLIPME
ncbi:MAG TPA: 4Fe-4S dicluster domain-containing protein [Archaeoglobus profundus]|nr:4Fe-4S dicluster domain-containing protein [Archaeoglobus profundus]